MTFRRRKVPKPTRKTSFLIEKETFPRGYEDLELIVRKVDVMIGVLVIHFKRIHFDIYSNILNLNVKF